MLQDFPQQVSTKDYAIFTGRVVQLSQQNMRYIHKGYSGPSLSAYEALNVTEKFLAYILS